MSAENEHLEEDFHLKKLRRVLVAIILGIESMIKVFIRFFNSQLGSWVLTSVLFAGIIQLYNVHKENMEKIRAAEERYANINAEIRYRLLTFRDEIQQYRENLYDIRSGSEKKNLTGKFPLDLVHFKPKRDNWYTTLRGYYSEAERPAIPSQLGYASYSVIQLFDDLKRTLPVLAKDNDVNLQNIIKESKNEWREINNICVRDYEKYRPEADDSKYYDDIDRKSEKIIHLLYYETLGYWIDRTGSID